MGVLIIIILIIAAGLIIKHKFNNWLAQGAARTQAVTSQINAANNGDMEAMRFIIPSFKAA